MKKLRVDKDYLEIEDIKHYIEVHEEKYRPNLDRLWKYYQGKNEAILDRKKDDENNPDNKTPIPYGRKIVTTFTGYAYRPNYITYKSDNEKYLETLQDLFDVNNEHIKTSLAGRNTGIYGVAYEILYLDDNKARFATLDPREVILLYNYDLEPKKVCAIRYYNRGKVDNVENYEVVVYYPSTTEYYTMEKSFSGNVDSLKFVRKEGNFFKEVQIIPYYMGDESIGIIEPVMPLLDDYDILVSDSMNEFDRFAHAYLRLVKMSLVPNAKNQNEAMRALKFIKKKRVFENLPDKDAVTFLTKDIPTEYIKFMSEFVREQIHVQSHVPDLSRFSDLSGIAVQRLMFDFENVVSSAEADFNTALFERIRMISTLLKAQGQLVGDPSEIVISHKRNAPLNIKEFADTAEVMNRTGFSRYLVADVMPDDVIPDIEAELERQDEEAADMFRSVEVDAEQPEEVSDGEDA